MNILCVGLASVPLSVAREALALHADAYRSERPAWLVMVGDCSREVLAVGGHYSAVFTGPLDLPLMLRQADLVLLGANAPYPIARRVRRYSWRHGLGIVLVGATSEEA